MQEFYTDNPETFEDYGRIINQRHFKRLMALMEGSTVAVGGASDESQCYIGTRFVGAFDCWNCMFGKHPTFWKWICCLLTYVDLYVLQYILLMMGLSGGSWYIFFNVLENLPRCGGAMAQRWRDVEVYSTVMKRAFHYGSQPVGKSHVIVLSNAYCLEMTFPGQFN